MKHQLPEGATAKVTHYRLVRKYHDDAPQIVSAYEIKKGELVPEPNGGKTEVTVTLADGREATGVANVSLKDNYCRWLGREIATGRALRELHLI